MRKLRSRGNRNHQTFMRACVEPLEQRRLLSLSPAADSALTATLSQSAGSAGAVPQSAQPSVTASNPANGDTNINRGTFIRLDVALVNGTGVDVNTLNTNNVAINRAS